MSAPQYQLKADFCTTLRHPARTRVLELLAGCEPAVAEILAQVRPEMGGSGTVPGGIWVGHMDGVRRRGPAGW